MVSRLSLFVLLMVVFEMNALANAPVDSIPADPDDISSPEAITGAFYQIISGKAGEKRNWDRFRTLFTQEAKLIAIGIRRRPDGTYRKTAGSVEDYIQLNEPLFDKDGFVERELSRKKETFGNVVHVFSTFEAEITKPDQVKTLVRGISSIQLFYDGKRWWVINVIWQNETEEFPIPSKYLEKTSLLT